MKLTNLTNRVVFIGNLARYDPTGLYGLKQGIKLLPAGDPSGRDVRDNLPDFIYHRDDVIHAERLAGNILVEFSNDPTSGVVQEEIGGGGGVVGAQQVIALQERRHSNTLAAWRTAARSVIDFNDIDTSIIKIHWNQVAVPPGGGDSAELRLRNTSDGVDLVVVTGIVTTGPHTTFVGPVPAGLKAVALQHQTVLGTGFSRIEGAAIYAG